MAKKNTKTEREESEALLRAADCRLVDLSARLESFRMDWGSCGLIRLLDRIDQTVTSYNDDLSCA